jgi:2-C-methyl-D-erythritol 4-phosphate cytidylyltransferase
MKKFAVLVAGGSGSRMNSELPKQFLSVNEKPVLFYTIKSFLEAFDDIHIILVLPQDYVGLGNEIVSSYFSNRNIEITVGGSSRFHSVKNGLSKVERDSVVFVHDAVRCLVSNDLIVRCYHQAVELGSAIPAINSKDSIRIIEDGVNRSVNRNNIRLIQTPQVFKSDVLLKAFEQPYQDSFTDEASVVEHTGYKVELIEGDENNIKITYPIDIAIAEKLLSRLFF